MLEFLFPFYSDFSTTAYLIVPTCTSLKTNGYSHFDNKTKVKAVNAFDTGIN